MKMILFKLEHKIFYFKLIITDKQSNYYYNKTRFLERKKPLRYNRNL